MIVPQKNLNGTATVDLADDAKRTLGHLRDGLRFMREMWPNGRDYVGKAKELEEAQRQFSDIVGRQEAIIKEIEAYLGGVMDR